MPWTKQNAPAETKDLPAVALMIWIEIANAALKTYKGDDAKAIATAWAALEKAGWAKDASGNWVKTQKASDEAEVEEFAMADQEKSGFSAAIKKDDMNGLVATHRRLHMWADKGNVLTGATAGDMEWMHNQVVDELKRRFEADPANKGKTYPQHESPLKYSDETHDETEFNFDDLDIDEFCQASAVWGQMKKRAAKTKKAKKGKKTQKHTDEEPADKFAAVREMFAEWGPVLKSVVLLGADAPAVKTLNDIEARGTPGELRNVEIFQTGYHNGKWHGLDKLQTIVRNFHALKDVVKVPLWIYHDDEQKLLRNSAATDGTHNQPAAGWIADLKLIGTKLIAPLVTDVPEMVRAAIQNRAFRTISAEIWPSFQFDEQAETELLGQTTEGGEDSVDTLTKAEAQALVDKAVNEKTLGLRDENARLKAEKDQLEADRDAAQNEVALASAQKFADEQKAIGLAPAVVDDLGLVKLIVSADDTEVEKFSDAKGAKPVTQRAALMAIVGELVKRAKAGKLFVEPGEKVPSEKFRDNAQHGDGEDTPDRAADRMAKHSKRVPRKEGEGTPYEL